MLCRILMLTCHVLYALYHILSTIDIEVVYVLYTILY